MRKFKIKLGIRIFTSILILAMTSVMAFLLYSIYTSSGSNEVFLLVIACVIILFALLIVAHINSIAILLYADRITTKNLFSSKTFIFDQIQGYKNIEILTKDEKDREIIKTKFVLVAKQGSKNYLTINRSLENIDFIMQWIKQEFKNLD